VRPLYPVWAKAPVPIDVTILASLGQIELHLSARGASRAVVDEALGRAVDQAVACLGEDAYSTDGRTMEQVVGDLLVERGLTIAAAESCTGGLFTSRLTDVPGSSRYVMRAVVAYANEAKVEWLGVPDALLREHGAVSEPVALAMADGIRRARGMASSRSGGQAAAPVHVGVGITGIAGPGGGTPEKPVGTVAIAVVTDTVSRSRTFRFIGEREQVKFQASQAAMDIVRRLLQQP
jgi:nicotinamide-nucleotide amidase